ncbi:class I SAM-dependent methyltransferase [Litorivicinus sp.]|nr:class I SAM-dependent methyltransferase [Litorivicinus sp.]
MKPVTDDWIAEATAIYQTYDLYHQSKTGKEQPVFNLTGKGASPRSSVILDYFVTRIPVADYTTALDIGCGSGAMLRALNGSSGTEHFQLFGQEPNPKNLSDLVAIDNVEDIFTKDISEISIEFDLITLIHALEHIPNPRLFIEQVLRLCTHSGVVLIQVPHYQDNPFDLIITDHCTHFTKATINAVVESAGGEIVEIATNVIAKEMTVIVKKRSGELGLPRDDLWNSDLFQESREVASVMVNKLHDLQRIISRIPANIRPIGIFGTAIAANWAFGILGGVDFFVEDDLDRIGRSYKEAPVIPLSEVPADSTLIIPIAPESRDQILRRLADRVDLDIVVLG